MNAPRRGPKSPAFTKEIVRQPVGDIVNVRIGWRATWSSKGRLDPETTVALRADEAEAIVKKGLATYV
jgi:kynurenine formamidase